MLTAKVRYGPAPRTPSGAVSEGGYMMSAMRIRTLAGPPLHQELLHDTMRAILLSHNTRPDAAAPDDRRGPVPTLLRHTADPVTDHTRP